MQLDRQCAFVERPSTHSITLGLEQAREAVEAFSRVVIFGTKDLLVDREGVLVEGVRARKVALMFKDAGKVVECYSCIWMLGARRNRTNNARRQQRPAGSSIEVAYEGCQ
jgi:hypothetical protein